VNSLHRACPEEGHKESAEPDEGFPDDFLVEVARLQGVSPGVGVGYVSDSKACQRKYKGKHNDSPSKGQPHTIGLRNSLVELERTPQRQHHIHHWGH